MSEPIDLTEIGALVRSHHDRPEGQASRPLLCELLPPLLPIHPTRPATATRGRVTYSHELVGTEWRLPPLHLIGHLDEYTTGPGHAMAGGSRCSPTARSL